MPSLMQRRGGSSEHRAVFFLRRCGYHIIERNYHTRYGEIDILAQDGRTMVAVEVKARRTKTFGGSLEAMSKKKFFRLVLSLQTYLMQSKQESAPHRIDLVAMDGQEIRLLKGIDVSGPTQ